MKCDHIQSQLTQYFLGDLPPAVEAEIREHLEKCQGCRAAAQEIEPTLDLLRDALAATSKAPGRLSDAARARVFASGSSKPRKRVNILAWFVQKPFRFVEVAAVLIVCAILAGLMLPASKVAKEHLQKFKMGEVVSGRCAEYEVQVREPPVEDVVVVNGAEGGVGGGGRVLRYGGSATAVRTPQAKLSPDSPHGGKDAKGGHVAGTGVDVPKQEVGGFYYRTPEKPATVLPQTDVNVHHGSAVLSGKKTEAASKSGSTVTPADLPPARVAWSLAANGAPATPPPASTPSSAVVMPQPPAKDSAVSPPPDSSVDVVKSPVVKQGVYSSRSPGTRGAEKTRDKGDTDGNGATVSLKEKDKSSTAEMKKRLDDTYDGWWRADKSKTTVTTGGVAGGDDRSRRYKAGDASALADADSARRAGNREISAQTSPVKPGVPAPGNEPFAERAPAVVSSSVPAASAARSMPEGTRETSLDAAGYVKVDGKERPTLAKEVDPKKTDAPVDRGERVVALIEKEKRDEIKGEIHAGKAIGRLFTEKGEDFNRVQEEERRQKVDRLRAEGRIEEAKAENDLALRTREELARERKEKAGRDLVVADHDVVTDSRTESKPKAVAGPVAAKPSEPETGPRFKAFGVNPFVVATEQPFSTFAIEVDTASYTLSRNYMLKGLLPPAEAVRTEEFVNFFDYAYRAPDAETFRIYVEAAPSKFGRGMHMMKIGVKGKRLGREEQRRAMLTFLIDTSGSMDKPDRIGLIRKSLKLLVEKLSPNDCVAIVQYDSHARLVVEHTPAAEREKLFKAIDALECSGSTNLEEGMNTAYMIAGRVYVPKAENRVLLLSDGVANLGSVTAQEILDKVAKYRKQGIFLSVFGVGMGTYNDEMLEALANKGDGVYSFIDSEEEARRVLVDDLSATLNTIAKDVKIQVEFNPKLIRQYRQLGYENRQLKKEQFRDDTVDAGEVGSGQSVTALYEMEMAPQVRTAEEQVAKGMKRGQLAVVRVRYCRVDNGKVEEIEQPVMMSEVAGRFEDAAARFRLAAGVAEFAEILRGSPFSDGASYEDVAKVLRPVVMELNLDGRVKELLNMVETAPGMARAPLAE